MLSSVCLVIVALAMFTHCMTFRVQDRSRAFTCRASLRGRRAGRGADDSGSGWPGRRHGSRAFCTGIGSGVFSSHDAMFTSGMGAIVTRH